MRHPGETEPAVVRYDCAINHARRTPLLHAFHYRSPMWRVDLDRVPKLPKGLRWIGSFGSADHWGDPTRTIRQNADAFLAELGRPPAARVVMVSGIRSMGHCFNPISIYWCYDDNGDEQSVIVEVHNTYAGRHAYLLQTDESGRATVDKDFYVSPFLDGHGRYRMRISPPGDRLDVVIALEQDGAVPFTAAMHGTATSGSRWLLLTRPLAQLRVVALIRLHGIKLWRKKVRLQPRAGDGVAPAFVTGNLRAGSDQSAHPRTTTNKIGTP